MKRYVVNSWINQKDNPFMENIPVLEAPISEPLPNQGDPSGVGMPGTDAAIPTGTNQISSDGIPPQQGQEPMQDMKPINQEPQDIPDNMEPEDEEPMIDFETEKLDYMNLAINKKNDEMMDKLLEMREIKSLTPGQYKFIEDNIQILSLSRDVDFADSQRKIYKQIKDSFQHLVPQEETDTEMPEEENQPPVQGPTGIQPGQSPEQQPPQERGQEQGMEFAHYNLNKNLKGIVFSEAPIDATALSGDFTPTGEVPGPDAAMTMNVSPQGSIPGPTNLPPEGEQSPPETDKSGNTGLEDDDITPERPSNEMEQISGTELYSIISGEIEQYKTITDCLVRLPNFYSMKSDLFRKVIASMINGVQIGSGGSLEDLFVPLAEDGVGIKICTRIYTDFGNIQIGKWSLQFNDPENFLSDAELKKLNDTGSPEEKEILRKRVIIESLAENFKDKVYVCMIIDPNTGERHEVGFNFAELMRDGWKNGYISVDFKASIGKGDAGVKVDGELIDLQKIQIDYVRENSNQLDQEGLPIKDHIELMQVQNGFLYVTIMKDEFTNFANDAQAGLFYSSKPFESGPEELKKVQRCAPDIKEIILKKC